ncbi:hypothetical protein ACHAWF_004528 [Thalassiosira exigua]
MPLTRSLSKRRKSKRRKTTTPASRCLSIDVLPDAMLGCVAGFLPKTSRLLLMAALSSPTLDAPRRLDSESWDTIDFADVMDDIAPRLTDEDLSEVLIAIKDIKILKLAGCTNITGSGLKPLGDSISLQQIDLSLVGKNEDPTWKSDPKIKEEQVLPILESMIDTRASFIRSLEHVQLPKLWRTEKSPALTRFLTKYNRMLNMRFVQCCNCTYSEIGGKCWMAKSGEEFGLQRHTCYECRDNVCQQCEPQSMPHCCENCEKRYCTSCNPTYECASCYDIACRECKEMGHCDSCHETYCNDCIPVSHCRFCDRSTCMDCRPHNLCTGANCHRSNCLECEDFSSDSPDDNVQWCESCEREFCNECRLKEYYQNKDDFCRECKSIVFHKIAAECESLRRQLEELQKSST